MIFFRKPVSTPDQVSGAGFFGIMLCAPEPCLLLGLVPPVYHATLRARSDDLFVDGRRIEHVAVERIDRLTPILRLGLSKSRRGESGKGDAQNCKTRHYGFLHFYGAHSAADAAEDSSARRRPGAASSRASAFRHRWQA